ncbi:MAG TPA: hypothetical protein VGY98_08710 [Verrucomicrobiae bacterium]|nr:hypothetical protein [Verrucomicrobiae bacterium]
MRATTECGDLSQRGKGGKDLSRPKGAPPLKRIYTRKPRRQNADEWFGMGSRFFEGHLVDEALRCFHHAKRLGHTRASLAIQICEDHGGHYLQPLWRGSDARP